MTAVSKSSPRPASPVVAPPDAVPPTSHAAGQGERSSVVRRLRLRARRARNESLVVEVAGRFHAAEFVDLSDTGAGLAVDLPLRQGDALRLHLGDGRVLAGSVCWQNGKRTGIAFAPAQGSAADQPPGTAAGRHEVEASAPAGLVGALAAALREAWSGRRKREQRALRRRQRLIETAYRANGAAWLADEGLADEVTPPAADGFQTP